jgi:hypothetical protein
MRPRAGQNPINNSQKTKKLLYVLEVRSLPDRVLLRSKSSDLQEIINKFNLDFIEFVYRIVSINATHFNHFDKESEKKKRNDKD